MGLRPNSLPTVSARSPRRGGGDVKTDPERAGVVVSAKSKGSRSELKVQRWYEERGWFVTKSGGSLGLWDLVGVHPDHGALVCQVKTNRPPRRPEMDLLRNFQVHPSVAKVLAIVMDYHGIKFFDL